MLKKLRQQKIEQIIRIHKVSNQHELLQELEKINIYTNQAAVSRDLTELGIFKMQGSYRLPYVEVSNSKISELFSVQTAGENLVVIKTSPGKAAAIAYLIDEQKLDEIIGTIAGDDALFIAIKDKKDQTTILKHITQHLLN